MNLFPELKPQDNKHCPYCSKYLMNGQHQITKVFDMNVIACPEMADTQRLVFYQGEKQVGLIEGIVESS